MHRTDIDMELNRCKCITECRVISCRIHILRLPLQCICMADLLRLSRCSHIQHLLQAALPSFYMEISLKNSSQYVCMYIRAAQLWKKSLSQLFWSILKSRLFKRLFLRHLLILSLSQKKPHFVIHSLSKTFKLKINIGYRYKTLNELNKYLIIYII